VYLYASGLSGLNSGWVKSGTWTANPPPAITSLSPTSTAAGGTTFTLTINGTSFVSGATAKWGTTSLATTFVSANQLTAFIPASLIATPGSASVTVTTSYGTSTGATFTINAQLPAISGLNPASVNAGSAVFTLTINGTNFVSGTTAKWGTTALATTFVSAIQLTASVPANLIATAGTAKVTVTTPSGTSAGSTFTINPLPPAIVSLSPNSGAGLSVTFSAKYSDPQGAAEINQAWLLVNSGTSGAGGCFVYYHPQANQLFLRNDSGSAWLAPGLTPGGVGSVANSQCTLNASSSSVSMSGNTLTLNVSVTFSASFAGARIVSLYASGLSGLNSGWVKEGTWTP
jgi:hypothetical protein